MRISRASMFMEIAHVVSKRSTCFRLNVGAVITYNNRIVSIGYNGRPAGQEHCQGNLCPGRYSCKETTHAEANAIDYLPFGLDMDGPELDLYCTDSPCLDCARKILSSGLIGRVYFGRPYRITEGVDEIIAAGLPVFQVMPSGYVLNWENKEIVNEA